jgi:hypothetical protein
MKRENIARAILADRKERVAQPKYEAMECLSCGRGFVYKGPSGDDSGRFCHARCREWYDAGNPTYEPSKVVVERANQVPLRDWKVVAGPPGLEAGSAYYADILDRGPKKERVIGKLANDELIRPRRLCDRCSQPLPVWINGRKVPSTRLRCLKCSPPKTQKRGNVPSRAAM